MTPLDRAPDQRPVPDTTSTTTPATPASSPAGTSAAPTTTPAPASLGDLASPASPDAPDRHPRLARTVEETRAALRALVAEAATGTGTGTGTAPAADAPVTVGFVPTMGALHDGHASLVRRARAENDVVVASIFVNPLQFGDPADLEHYPRTLEADLDLLGAAGADLAFAPEVQEMYPGYPDAPIVTVSAGRMGEVLEGASRPGHFDGVATVVAKLWNIVGPAAPVLRSYFGQKDAQQVAVLRRVARDLDVAVDVRSVPIVRSPEGLALSSRNTRLDAEGLERALVLSRALRLLADASAAGRPVDVEAARAMVRDEPGVELDHLVVVDPETLQELGPDTLGGPLRREALALVAAHVPPVRLIDNMVLPAAAG